MVVYETGATPSPHRSWLDSREIFRRIYYTPEYLVIFLITAPQKEIEEYYHVDSAQFTCRPSCFLGEASLPLYRGAASDAGDVFRLGSDRPLRVDTDFFYRKFVTSDVHNDGRRDEATDYTFSLQNLDFFNEKLACSGRNIEINLWCTFSSGTKCFKAGEVSRQAHVTLKRMLKTIWGRVVSPRGTN